MTDAEKPISRRSASDTGSSPATMASAPSVASETHAGRREIEADLVVIGGGSGGLSAAAGAAMLGLNVVLYEKGEMGGDCLNYGCVPSKALLYAAKQAHAVREAAAYGVSAGAPQIDWARVRAHVRGTIEAIAPVDSQERFEGLGVTVIREHAKFADPKTIVSATTQTRARRIIVATGSSAFIPPIEGLEDVAYLTNETIFTIDELPQHLLVLGGGPIGMEMAQAFNRLGAKVTLIEMDRVLAAADRAHAAVAADQLRAEGVDIREGHKAVRVSHDKGTITVHTTSDAGSDALSGSHLLVAVGRRPVLNGLDLEAGGVEHDRSGITVRDTLRSVSNSRVWALGDVAGRGQFTHLAGWHASVFVRRAFFKSPFSKASSLPVPAVTYTSPEVAQIGLTEAEAREKYASGVASSHFAFAENDRAIAENHKAGEARLVIRKGTIIGASIVGEGAGEIIQMIALAMSNGLKVKDLTNFISPYPTRTEVVKRAASAHFADTVFGPGARRLVGFLQKIP